VLEVCSAVISFTSPPIQLSSGEGNTIIQVDSSFNAIDKFSLEA